MTQPVKALVTKPEDLSSGPRTPITEDTRSCSPQPVDETLLPLPNTYSKCMNESYTFKFKSPS